MTTNHGNRNFVSQHGLLPDRGRFAAGNSALLVVDMQAAFVEPGELLAIPAAQVIVPSINHLITAFREAGGLIVFMRHTVTDEPPYVLPDWLRHDPWMAMIDPLLRPNAPSHALHERIDFAPSDLVIDKFRASAFNRLSSNLDDILAAKNIETIVVVGCTTNICCESTARDGYMLGYRTIVVHDAMAARTVAEHDASLLNLSTAFADVRSVAEVLAMIVPVQDIDQASVRPPSTTSISPTM